MGFDHQSQTRRGPKGATGRPKTNRIKSKLTHCWDCGFQSKRAFNVIRHHERIHGPTKRELECCGRIFPNKGRWYQHCADRHPETRKSSKVSSTKYKITSGSNKQSARRRSSRLLKPKKENNNDPSYLDENKPLINSIEHPKPIKKEELVIKQEDDNDHMEIIFEGDANSPIHSRILREYLKVVDFDSFKLPYF